MMWAIFMLAVSAPANTPRAFVERLYSNYRHADFSPFAQTHLIFDRPLAAAISEDQRLARGEVGFLDGDPLCDCQDTGGMHAKIYALQSSGRSARARLSIRFDGSSEKRDIQIQMVLTPSGWRISDIASDSEASLLRALRASNRRAKAR
jgi:hypothetical protein